MVDEQVLLASDDIDALAEYQSVSRLAIASLVLGIASLVALAHPVAWVIPLVGTVVALFAVRVTSDPDIPLGGRQAAIWGLCLSVFIGVGVVGFWTFQRQIVQRQARQFANRFVEIVLEGDYGRAVQCMRSHRYRTPASIPAEVFYSQNEEARAELDRFRQEEIVEAIATAGPTATLRYLGNDKIERANYSWRCWLRYELIHSDKTKTEFLICVVRDTNPESYLEPHWHILRFQIAQPARVL